MNPKIIEKNTRLCHALIGMSYQQFIEILPLFSKSLREHYESLPNRQKRYGGGKKGYLKTDAHKLFFILLYIKTYPTFDVLSMYCLKGRGRCCESVHLYLKILEKALGKKMQLPVRKITSVEEFELLFPNVKDIFIDGTERKIQRPADSKRNKRHYSGKKKTHTRKNIVVVDERKRILVMSPTKPGRRHDKNCVDRMCLIEKIPESVTVWGDSGFQGIASKHKNSLIAKRGSRNKKLTIEDKENNRVISSFRVVVENALAGMKRFRSVTDVLRNKIGVFDDRVALVTAGIWNYRLSAKC